MNRRLSVLKIETKLMLKRILKILGILLLGLVIALVLAPILLKDTINSEVKKSINEALDAKVDYAHAKLSFFKDFPFPTISISDIDIAGIEEFQGEELFSAEEIFVRVGLASLFNKEAPVELTTINIVKPHFNIIVSKDAKANYHIYSSSSTQGDEGMQLDINEYAIIDGSLKYSNYQNHSFGSISNINHSGRGDFKKSIFSLQTQSTLEGIDFKSNNIKYARNLEARSNMPIEVDLNQNKYSISNGLIYINDFKLLADGNVIIGEEDMTLNMSSKASDNSVKEFLSLVPYAYTKDFEKVDASGQFDYKALVNGKYTSRLNSYPAFELLVDVKNGKVKYPELSLPIENINLSVDLDHKGGDINNASIDIRPLEFSIDGEKLYASLSNNSADGKTELTLNTKMDISKIQKAYPLPGVQSLTGLVDIDLSAIANLNTLSKNDFSQFKGEGKVNISDMVYTPTDGQTLHIKTLKSDYNNDELIISESEILTDGNDIRLSGKLEHVLDFYFNDKILTGDIVGESKLLDLNKLLSPKDSINDNTPVLSSFDNISVDIDYNAEKLIYTTYEIDNLTSKSEFSNDAITINSATGKIGSSDFNITGKLHNLYNYTYQTDTLQGNLIVASDKIDYIDFSEEEANSNSNSEIPIIPDNVNIDMKATAKTVVYENIKIKNASANLDIIPSRVNVTNFTGNTFGGDIALDGYYATDNPQNPLFGLKYQMEKMNFSEAIKANKTFSILAPIAKFIEGKFNSTLVLEGLLTKELMPDFNSLTGTGFLETLEGKISGFQPVEELSGFLNLKKGSDWLLRGTKNWFDIKNGALQVKEFDYAVKDIKMKISGSHRFNMDMNYLVKASIPRKYVESNELGKALTKEFDQVIAEVNKRGLDIQSGSYVDADLLVTGNIKNPSIDIINVRIAEKPLTEQVKDQVKQKVQEKTTAVKDTVRSKIDETVTSIKDTLTDKTNEIKDTVVTIVEKTIEENKEKVKDIIFTKVDTLVKGKLPDSTITVFKDQAAKILNKNTDIKVDSILSKIKNPFKIKKKSGN